MDLYTQTKRSIDETENSLMLRLESARGNADQFGQISQQITQNIQVIQSNISQLDLRANKVAPQRRQQERQKVEQLKYTLQSINASLSSAERRHENELERSRGRDELLNRRYTANDNIATTSVEIGNREAAHAGKLSQAHNDIDGILNGGYQILENLQQDTQVLKGAKTKMLNILNTLGLSNTVMRLIDKRTTQDKFLLYGLMIVSALIMYGAFRYFSGWKKTTLNQAQNYKSFGV